MDQAHGRVLAESVLTAEPVPRFSHSVRDGFAIATGDLVDRGPWTLPISGESRAGHSAPPLPSRSACRIFTGAPLPAGADAVVMQEDVVVRDKEIVVADAPVAGHHIRPRGSDLAEGATALTSGSRLTAGRLGLVAFLDRPYLVVARRPTVAIVSTGDELRLPGEPGRQATIVESNSLVMATVARGLGASVRLCPLVPDEPEATVRDLRRAMRGSDVVVTVGGSGVGEYDWVRPAIETLGVRLEFAGAAIRPGRGVAAGRGNGCRVLCLPGNPAAAVLTFLLFVTPLVRALQGERPCMPRHAPLRVLGSHVKRTGVQEYLRARLEEHDGELCAALLPSQSSGAVTGFAEAQALVVAATDRKHIRNGDRLPTILLSELGC